MDERLVRLSYVSDIEIKNRAAMIEFRRGRQRQHQPNAGTVKEGKTRRRGEQKLHSQDITIESGSAFDVMGVDGDLRDCRKCEGSTVRHL